MDQNVQHVPLEIMVPPFRRKIVKGTVIANKMPRLSARVMNSEDEIIVPSGGTCILKCYLSCRVSIHFGRAEMLGELT